MPKVSIGIPVYNGENYIASAIEGVLNQTYEDLELVITDNASTDGTSDICSSYAARDSRVRYFRNPENLGASPNFNKVFHESTGEYFAWKAHDDYYAPTWVQKCVEALDNDPDVILAYSLIRMLDMENNELELNHQSKTYFDQNGNEFMGDDPLHVAEQNSPAERFASVLHQVCWCLQVFGMYRRDLLAQTKLQRSYYGGDKVLLADLAIIGKYHQVQEKLFNKRVHPKMSFFQSTAEKRKWIDSKAKAHIPQVLMVQDYHRAISSSRMTAAQKMRCYFAILQMFQKRKGALRRFLVPGPDNYFGINFGMASRAKQLSKS